MNDVFTLSERQMEQIEPFFPLAHGVPRVDDRRVLSGIVYVIRNGLQWKDAPKAYGPHKTLYNRFIRRSRPGVFRQDFCRPLQNRLVVRSVWQHDTTAGGHEMMESADGLARFAISTRSTSWRGFFGLNDFRLYIIVG